VSAENPLRATLGIIHLVHSSGRWAPQLLYIDRHLLHEVDSPAGL